MAKKSKRLELSQKCIETLTIEAAQSDKKFFKPYAEMILEKVAATPILKQAFKQPKIKKL